jgi:hypothetical protein
MNKITWSITVSFHHLFAFFLLISVTLMAMYLKSEQVALMGIPAVAAFYMNKHYQQRKEREPKPDE